MASSLAFWTDQKVTAYLHFNLWQLPQKKTRFSTTSLKDFLDVGILLEKNNINKKNIKLNIFIPFKFEEECFKDLSKVLTNDNLLDAIFNKPLTCQSEPTSLCYTVENEDKTIEFLILNIGDPSLVNINKCNDGTYLSILIPTYLLKTNNMYIRFRIMLNKDTNFSEYVNDGDSLLRSNYRKEELVEFRINETRNLPKDLQSTLKSSPNQIQLKEIHFFLVRENDAHLELSHDRFKRCRSVETNIWETYIKDVNCDLENIKRILSYHWCEKAKPPNKDKGRIKYIEHYGTFAKFSYTSTDTIVYYILIFLLISFTIELTANYISSIWEISASIALVDLPIIAFIGSIIVLLIYALCKFMFTKTKPFFVKIWYSFKTKLKLFCNLIREEK
ncbi:hypothetical protein CRV03_05855 [Arcobacter sp. F155]|uniref:hypothetical protein n=1 Tax=Arcobacter sp. F155 TaxID=2044512 RepID=UPI00100B8C5F|nr:hypothetical protein [Arcobacter sp. F155]RXJ77208.1 hypothetical protein CRV03_05855 [Arcobacter sp. F155]